MKASEALIRAWFIQERDGKGHGYWALADVLGDAAVFVDDFDPMEATATRYLSEAGEVPGAISAFERLDVAISMALSDEAGE